MTDARTLGPILAVCLGCALAGCDEVEAPTDAGPTIDAGGALDAGPLDAGPLDAGPTDAGSDAGGDVDAGADAGEEAGDAGIDPGTVPAPRPIEPASGALTTSPTVRFRWALTAPATGARLEICRDPACVEVRETLDVDGETTETLVPPDPAPSSRVFYFRLTGRADGTLGRDASPVWPFSVHGRVSVAIAATWGSVNDLDGDGLSDVVASAPASSAVRVFRGRSPIGSAPSPDTQISATPALELGRAVVRVGDVDGDGIGDLAVASTSSIYLFTGVAGGWPIALNPDDAASTITDVGSPTRATVAAAGDVDRDGHADLIVGLPDDGRVLLFRGSASGLEATPVTVERSEAGFGRSVAGACDVNADGFADVIVGADDAVFVLEGTPTGLADPEALTAGAGSADLGAAVACAGDVNGDGYPDVIVGAPGDHAAFLYPGGPSGVSTLSTWVVRKQPGESGFPTKHGARFGAVVGAAGDANGDGYGDILVVAPDVPEGLTENPFVGYAFVFHGSSGGVGSTSPGTSTMHDTTLGSSLTVAANRVQVSTYAGDVDGDGYGDIVSGAPARDGGAGAILLNLGSGSGIPLASAWLVAGGSVAGFGGAVAMLDAWMPTGWIRRRDRLRCRGA